MKILLYYKYTKIDDPEGFCKEQKALCERLGIKGRILIAEEGINGTCGGSDEALDEYMKQTELTLGEIDWKISLGPEDSFPRLRVVIRPEIVTLGLKSKGLDVDISNKADYIEPEELKELYDKNEEFYIIDGRNNYESKIGRFKNSIWFDINSFRDIPDKVKEIENLKDKKVITFCTGGIRCEKFSAYLKEEGFKDVKQLHGGIIRYSEKTGGKYFEGEMYIFDGRIHVPVNFVNPKVISECEFCGVKITRYKNCKNKHCNKRMIICEECEVQNEGFCSKNCLEEIKK